MNKRKIVLGAIMLLEWFGLSAQLVVHIQTIDTGIAESLLRFFSYFTILTNLLVCIYATKLFFAPSGKENGFFFRPSVQTAIALYITVVGLIYNILLRQLWDSSGLQAVLHDILHTAIPIMVLIYWWIWVSAKDLTFKETFPWLIYPAVYAVLILIEGAFVNWYPYPFLDALTYGYLQILINSVFLLFTFLFFSGLFVFMGKKK